MSLIIDGLNLPKKGENHVLVIHDDGRVERAFGTDRGTKLVLWTEAIQIPKGHGRLIDGDELRKEFNRTESGYCGGWEFCDKPEDVQFLIDEAPTILEGEE